VPRDIGGQELAKLLQRYGYRVSRQTGSHLRLTSSLKGAEHHVSIPKHNPLKVGTLSNVLKEVAAYLEMDKEELLAELLRD
jgi:predicted RNA binding protein YcfA (HicA-like mRNA interferase family)